MIDSAAELSGNVANADSAVDARNMACPLPLLQAKKALNALNRGQCVAIVASDPASEKDFHSFIELTNHELVQFKKVNNLHNEPEFHYLIRKGATA